MLLAGVLEHHDRARFEVFAYSTGPDDASAMRARIVAAVEHFIDIRDRRPARLAARIRADSLDVLVDLKGYTEGAPTAALALRPAPIQAHWIGYPGTMAAPFIDYLLVDKVVVPDAHRADYPEALVRLPHCYQPNDRSRLASAAPSREGLGLTDAGVVFAGFNAPWKFNADVFDAWARILAATPRSVLWLLARDDDDPMTGNARRELGGRGIASERIVFADRRAQADYLALFSVADIFLDTWPYNAHTTASDALWMGCPVVTLPGETFAGRVGASLLDAVGLPELAAASTEDYVALAIALAERFRPTRPPPREAVARPNRKPAVRREGDGARCGVRLRDDGRAATREQARILRRCCHLKNRAGQPSSRAGLPTTIALKCRRRQRESARCRVAPHRRREHIREASDARDRHPSADARATKP